jgi:cadmium resistance protein CadD (predicted permease)
MKRSLGPLVLVFVIINALALVFAKRLQAKNIDSDVIIMGNLVLFLASAASVYIYTRSSKSKGQAVVRNIYGGFMLKFFVLIIAAMLYFFFADEINTAAVFVCLGLYLVYSIIGTRQSVRQTTSNKQATAHHAEHKDRPKHQHHSHRKR